jgi:hypothetical protein
MVAAFTHAAESLGGTASARGRRVVGLGGSARGLPALRLGPPAKVDVLDLLTDPISKPVQAAMWVRASQVWTSNGSGSLHRLGWFGPKRCWRGAADSARPSDPSAALSLFCDPAASPLGNRTLLTCLTTCEEG